MKAEEIEAMMGGSTFLETMSWLGALVVSVTRTPSPFDALNNKETHYKAVTLLSYQLRYSSYPIGRAISTSSLALFSNYIGLSPSFHGGSCGQDLTKGLNSS